MNRDIYMSDNRYLAALQRMRKSIESGTPCRACNSDMTGDHHNECTWGLCSDRKEDWPDPEDHLWPDQFRDRGRVAPLYLKPHQLCPLDQRMETAPGGAINWNNGCFWTCRIFRDRGKPKPTREEALALYDQAIERIQTNAAVSGAEGGNVTSEDQG